MKMQSKTKPVQKIECAWLSVLCTFVLLASSFTTAAWAQNATSASPGKKIAYMAKIEMRQLGDPSYTQFANGVFIDQQSLKSSVVHRCEGRTLLVTSNDLLKGLNLGQSVKVKIRIQYGKVPNENNIFLDADASIRGRDYFSGAALLEINSGSEVTTDVLACVGLNNAGEMVSVMGFKYYSMMELPPLPLQEGYDKGFRGALGLDKTGQIPVGLMLGNYFARNEAKPEEYLKPRPFAPIAEFASRVFQGRTQSSKGLVYYFPNSEQFVVKGGKDAFVMGPERDDGTGRVRIYGAPEEILSGNGSSELSGLSISNSFSGLARTLASDQLTMYLKSVDGHPASEWETALRLLSGYLERSSPTIEYEVSGTGGRTVSFLVGDVYLENLSKIRWIHANGTAILDSDKDNGPRRALKDNERNVLNQIIQPLNRIYEAFSKNPPGLVVDMPEAGRRKHYENLLRDSEAVMNILMPPPNRTGKFPLTAKTMSQIQSWVAELDKYIANQARALTRVTNQFDNSGFSFETEKQ